MKIDLDQRRYQITLAASKAVQEILDVPPHIRNDEKQRTGIQVLVREPDTRNLVFLSIGKPSEAAQFFAVEKAVRSHLHGHMASANSEDTLKMQYSGSVTCELSDDGTLLQASVSGMKAEEDVTIAIFVLASILEVPPINICALIRARGGELPECLRNPEHYLHKLIVWGKQ